MPQYRFIKCGNCGYENERFGSPYEVIGVPYFNCFQCNRLNVQSRIINEWDLKWDSEKRKYLLYMLFFSIFLGFGSGSMVYGFAFGGGSFTGILPWAILISCWIIMYGLLLLYFRKQVKDSRKRLMNREYLWILIQLGVVRSNDLIVKKAFNDDPVFG